MLHCAIKQKSRSRHSTLLHYLRVMGPRITGLEFDRQEETELAIIVFSAGSRGKEANFSPKSDYFKLIAASTAKV
jgi:hypothetical protein